MSISRLPALMTIVARRSPWAILALLSGLGVGCERQAESLQEEPFIAWQTVSGRAMEAIENAGHHDVNALIVEFEPSDEQPGRVWSTFIDDLAFNDHTPRVAKQGRDRANVEKLRSNISNITTKGSAAGLSVYLVATEFSFPKNLIAAYPEARDPDSPFLWAFLERRLEEVLLALPQAAGVLLYTDEPSDLIPYHFEPDRREATLSRLLQVYLDVCSRLDRRFIVCTMVNFESRKLDLLLSVLKRIPPSEHLLVSNYVCPGDWGLIALLNPAIGNVGGHPEFLTFDYSGELWGQGNIPLIQARLIADRVRQAKERGANLIGINGYVSWYTQSLFGTPSELNLDLAPRILRDPIQGPDDLVRELLDHRYGPEAASHLAEAFSSSFEVADKVFQTLGFYVTEAPKSAFPDAVWIDFSLRTESLAAFDPSYEPLKNQLVHPDGEILQRVIEEKDLAVKMAAEALAAVRRSRSLLAEEDFELLELQFAFTLEVAQAYREYFEAYLRTRQWDLSGRGSVPAGLEALIRQLQVRADRIEKNFGSPPVFCAASLRHCADMLQGFLQGETFPYYPEALVKEHVIPYPQTGLRDAVNRI